MAGLAGRHLASPIYKWKKNVGLGKLFLFCSWCSQLPDWLITRYSDWIFSFSPIACGLQTPYMERVQNHLKNEGAFHDNQCPRCPERFASRDEFVNHLETSNHIGMRTMHYELPLSKIIKFQLWWKPMVYVLIRAYLSNLSWKKCSKKIFVIGKNWKSDQKISGLLSKYFINWS